MANPEHLKILNQGVDAWNKWRKKKPNIRRDLRAASLPRASLSKVNFSHVNLRGADLGKADLRSANLVGAILREADLHEGDLGVAKLRRANLIGVNLSKANLSGADLRCALLTGSNLSSAYLYGARLTGSDLKGADLREAILQRANITEADLRGANLYRADLSQASLYRANLIDVDLRGANLTEADLRRVVFPGALLNGLNLNGVDLSNANLRWAYLAGADLRGATLYRSDLSHASLHRANLSEVALRGANLAEADLREAELNGADLSWVNFSGANLCGANLCEAYLNSANLHGANVQGANLICAGLIRADLSQADLRGTVLTVEGQSIGASSFLGLSTCYGLDTATFSESYFLEDYLTRAFEYVHKPGIPEAKDWPVFLEYSIRNIKALCTLYADKQPPKQLIEVIHTITAELIKYLKKHPKAMYQLKPRQFEELIAEILASYKWDVQLTPPIKDGGYDIFAISKDIKPGMESSWIIECKKYRSENKVGVDIVRALYGVKSDLKVANALLATTSYFTKGAKDFKASRYDIELKDYLSILEWINQYRPNPNGKLYIKDNKLILPEEQ